MRNHTPQNFCFYLRRLPAVSSAGPRNRAVRAVPVPPAGVVLTAAFGGHGHHHIFAHLIVILQVIEGSVPIHRIDHDSSRKVVAHLDSHQVRPGRQILLNILGQGPGDFQRPLRGQAQDQAIVHGDVI